MTNRVKTSLMLLAVSVCLASALDADSAAQVSPVSPQYRMEEIGTLGGLITQPSSINDAGQVVGYALTPDGGQHAFLWQRGKMTELSCLKGDQSSMAISINNAGQIIGISSKGQNGILPNERIGGECATHAVLWDHGKVIDLGLIGSDDLHIGGPKGINDKGQIIVNRITMQNDSIQAMLTPSLQHSQAFLCTRAGIQSGQVLGEGVVNAAAINNDGEIVGQFRNAQHHLRAYLWKNGAITDLGGFQPMSVNASGEVVGVRLTGPPAQVVAMVWNNGTLTQLRAPHADQSFGIAINDNGDILGYSVPATTGLGTTPSKAILLWQKGQVVDVSNRINMGSRWEWTEPTAMNNQGQIVCYGLRGKKVSAFLLTPAADQTP